MESSLHAALLEQCSLIAPVGICHDDRLLRWHRPLPNHPEDPQRLKACIDQLSRTGVLQRCQQVPPRKVTNEELEAVHSRGHIRWVPCLYPRAARGPNYWDWELERQEWWQSRNVDPHAAEATAAAIATTGGPLDTPVASGNCSVSLGDDMFADAHTAEAAQLATGCCAACAEAVADGSLRAALALVRPPGHHAGRSTYRGFCYFNNVAVAARAAQRRLAADMVAVSKDAKPIGLPNQPKPKVAIVDWDVHHGDGTQEIFEEDETVLYISLHRHGQVFGNEAFYPGTGCPSDVGLGAAAGCTVNIGFGMGAGAEEYDAAFEKVVMPVLREFAPRLVLVSCGFDSAAGDPLGDTKLTPSCYARFTRDLMTLRSSLGIVLIFEGGYDPELNAMCTEAVVRALLGEPEPLCSHEGPTSSQALASAPMKSKGVESIQAVLQAQHAYWSCFSATDLAL